MQVVPVMDCSNGRAVHAVGGDRSRYPVVEGALGSGHDPVALAGALRDRFGCDALYLADLDAIQGTRPDLTLLRSLAALGLDVWCDAGTRTRTRAESLLEAGAGRVVVGLETLRSLAELAAVTRGLGGSRVVFSLDVHDGHPMAGAADLASRTPADLAREAAGYGVEHILCLDLARVGSRTGPPVEMLARVAAATPTAALYAGGGVRHASDLATLAVAGCRGALVATALHQGRITPVDLQRFRGPGRVRPKYRGRSEPDPADPG